MASLSSLSSLSSFTGYDSPPTPPRRAETTLGTRAYTLPTRRILNFDESDEPSTTSSLSSHYINSIALTAHSSMQPTRRSLIESWDNDHDDSSTTFVPLNVSTTASSSRSAGSSSSASSFSDSISSSSSTSSAAITSTVATSLLSPRGKKRIDFPVDELSILRRLSLSPSSHLFAAGPSAVKRSKVEEMEENLLIQDISAAPIRMQIQASDGKTIRLFRFRGIDYPIRLLSDDGVMNLIWEFTIDTEIIINGNTLRTSGLIIKTPREFKKCDADKLKGKKSNLKIELKETIRTFKSFYDPSTIATLKKLGLRIPNYYFTPLDKDPITGEQCAFWIIERMAEGVQLKEWEHHTEADTPKSITRFEELSRKNKKLLEIVRNSLSYILENARNLATDVICRLDFHPGNLMFDSNGDICYVDGNVRWDYGGDIFEPIAHATTWLTNWAANNPDVLVYLRTPKAPVIE